MVFSVDTITIGFGSVEKSQRETRGSGWTGSNCSALENGMWDVVDSNLGRREAPAPKSESGESRPSQPSNFQRAQTKQRRAIPFPPFAGAGVNAQGLHRAFPILS